MLSFPQGTEMFQFPWFPLPALCVQTGVPQHAAVGFPIRTSTDQSLVGSSPWLIAATHVLHRLQAPRHPPLALCSLENKDARARYGILKDPTARPATGRRRQEVRRRRTLSLSMKGLMPLVNGTEVVQPTPTWRSEDESCKDAPSEWKLNS